MREGRSKEYLKTTRRRGKYQLPVERLLRSKLGQNWNKLYSEFSAEFDKRTPAGREFFKSLEWNVETKCWKGADTGTIYTAKGTEAFGFYVHPMSGCLEFKVTPPRPKRVEPLTRIVIAQDQYYDKIDGVWYYTEYRPLYPHITSSKDKTIGLKRQLNAHEMKTLKVHNESVEEQKRLKAERKKKEREAYQWLTRP